MRGRLVSTLLLPLSVSAASCSKTSERPQNEPASSAKVSISPTSELPRGPVLPAAASSTNDAKPTEAPPTPNPPSADANAAPAASASCPGGAPPKAWLTNAGCVKVQRCPGVPGPCTTSCVPFPKQCSSCANCACVGKALCGRGAAPICRGYDIMCAEP